MFLIMRKRSTYRYLLFFELIFLLTILDLMSKWYFTGKSYFIDSLIYIYSTQNTGSALGLFSSIESYNLLIILISIVLLGLVIYYLKTIVKTKFSFTVGVLFTAGLLGNLYDRIIFGYVRDFIGIQGLFIFNIADLYLTMCAVILILHEISENKALKTKK